MTATIKWRGAAAVLLVGLLISLSACDPAPVVEQIPEITLTGLDGKRSESGSH